MRVLFCFLAAVLALAMISGVKADGASFTVYDNSGCTVPATSIVWGSNLSPDQNYTCDIYVMNTGSVAFTGFSVAVSDADPSNATTYLGLSAMALNASELPLQPQQSVELALQLNVASDAPGGAFSFNIILNGLAGSTGGGSSSGGSSGGGGYSQTLHVAPSAAKTPAASSGMPDLGLVFLVAAVGVVAFLFAGKKH